MKLSHFALAGLFLLLGAGIYLTMKTEMDGRLDELKVENEQKFEKYEKAQREQAALIAKNAEAMTKTAETAKEKVKQGAAAVAEEVKTVKTDIRKTASAVADDIKSLTPKKPSRTEPVEIADAPPENPAPSVADATVDATEAAIQEKERNILNDTGIGSERMAIERGQITRAIPEGERLTKVQSLVKSAPAIARVKEVKEADGFVVLDRGRNANLAKGDKFSIRRGTFILGPITIADTIEANQCVADVGKLIEGAALQKGDEVIQWNPQDR